MSDSPSTNPYESPQTQSDPQLPLQTPSARPRFFAACVIGFATGYFVWASSRFVMGVTEPWDAAGGQYYLGVITVGGFLAGVTSFRYAWVAVLGIWGGQCAALLTVPWLAEGGWFLLGVFTTVPGAFFALPGILLGSLFCPWRDDDA